MCDPGFSTNFLREIQVHYDMNFKPNLLIEKLQMLTTLTLGSQPRQRLAKVWAKKEA
jgi:hypothetical protein